MNHVLAVYQKGSAGLEFLVAIRVHSSRAILMSWETEAILNAYSKQYDVNREGLIGLYMPLIEIDGVDNILNVHKESK